MTDAVEAEAVRSFAERVRALPNPYDEGAEATSEAMLAVGFEKGRHAVLALLQADAPDSGEETTDDR